MIFILKTFGEKGLIRKLVERLAIRKGYFLYSSIRYPHEWDEV